jgi:hypothetical protein
VGEVHITNDEGSTYMVPVPDEVEDKVEEEERASRMSNALVWERTEVTSPTGEAWKVYPGLQRF